MDLFVKCDLILYIDITLHYITINWWWRRRSLTPGRFAIM